MLTPAPGANYLGCLSWGGERLLHPPGAPSCPEFICELQEET